MSALNLLVPSVKHKRGVPDCTAHRLPRTKDKPLQGREDGHNAAAPAALSRSTSRMRREPGPTIRATSNLKQMAGLFFFFFSFLKKGKYYLFEIMYTFFFFFAH